MLSGLNTTGHEIGGTIGIAILVTIATAASGGAGAAPGDRLRGRAGTPTSRPASSPAPLALHWRSCPRPGLPAKVAARPEHAHPLRPHVPPTRQPSPPRQPRRRADAERSVARILDAAVEALASDPEAEHGRDRSSGRRRARDDLRPLPHARGPDRRRHRAGLSEVTRLIEAAEPDRGDAAQALATRHHGGVARPGRFHALVAMNTRLPQDELHRRHLPLLEARAADRARTARRHVPARRVRQVASRDDPRARPCRQRRAARGTPGS